MNKRIFILSLCVIALIAAFAIIGRNRDKAVSKGGYAFKGSTMDVPIGTASSANYKLTAGAINLPPENEEVYSHETH